MMLFKQHFVENKDFSKLCWNVNDSKFLDLGVNILPLSYNDEYIFKFFIGDEELIFYYNNGYHIRYSSKDFQKIKIFNVSLISCLYFKFINYNSILSILFSSNGLIYENIVDLEMNYNFEIKMKSSGHNIINIVHSEEGNL